MTPCLSPERIAELRAGLIEHRKRWSGDTHADLVGPVDYEASEALMRDAADHIADLTAQLAAKDVEIDHLRLGLSIAEKQRDSCEAALKAQRDSAGGTISDEMVEAAAKAMALRVLGLQPQNYDLNASFWMPYISDARAALTAANLAPGTRAGGLRRAAGIADEERHKITGTEAWCEGMRDMAVRLCNRFRAEIKQESP